MIFKKINASALQLTLFIAVVIALLLAAFLILLNTYKQFNIKSDFVVETTLNATNGIEYALHHVTTLNDTIEVNIHIEDYKTLKTQRSYWGVFEKLTSKSLIKNYTFQRIALVGAEQPEINRMALYLEDNNKPLVVVGSTTIQGVAYLPKRGVKTGNISGISYYGKQLIYGNTQRSISLPKLTSETENQLKHLSIDLLEVSRDNFLDISKQHIFNNSFFEPMQLVYSLEDINLTELTLTGNIIVKSETRIVVEASTNLSDVVLIAPQIEIKNNVTGTFQAIASESITVGKNCKLKYPSAMVVYNNEQSIESLMPPKGIVLDQDTIINGILLSITETIPQNYEPQIVIGEHSIVKGEVYCNSNIELKGSVYGSIYTSNFIAKQSGSIYQNHVYNGNILIDSLPQQYIGLPFQSTNKNVAKWLY